MKGEGGGAARVRSDRTDIEECEDDVDDDDGDGSVSKAKADTLAHAIMRPAMMQREACCTLSAPKRSRCCGLGEGALPICPMQRPQRR